MKGKEKGNKKKRREWEKEKGRRGIRDSGGTREGEGIGKIEREQEREKE